jgi:superfamily II DNA or RNA helicase
VSDLGYDVAYLPDGDVEAIAREHSLSRVLVLGPAGPELLERLAETAGELRVAPSDAWEHVLHVGAYLCTSTSGAALLLVRRGLDRATEQRGRRRHVGGHLGTAEPVLDALWASAQEPRTRSRFATGDIVRLRGSEAVGTVKRTTPRLGSIEVTVDVDGRVQNVGEDALELVEGDPRDPVFWLSQPPGSADDLALTITWTKLTHPLTDTVYSYASSKTLFRPYQFLPVLKLLGSASDRLLIADEVGLGKTIEAGLVWSELEQRTRLDRALVVCPSALVLKWKSEMARRFDRDLSVLRAADLRDFAEAVADGREPTLCGVTSLEGLRSQTDLLEALNAVNPRLDLVIVDEAHALRNRGRRSYQLGRLLSDWSDVLLFLSATPLNLGETDLFNLVNLLAEDQFFDERIFPEQLEPNAVLNRLAKELRGGGTAPRKLIPLARSVERMPLGGIVTQRPGFEELCSLLDTPAALPPATHARAKRLVSELNTLSGVLTRTRKVDVPDAKAVRVAEQLVVPWTDQELRMYQAISAAYAADYKARGVPPGFAMQMVLRQAASCLPAVQESVRKRRIEAGEEAADVVQDAGPELGTEEPLTLDADGTRVDLLEPLVVDTKYQTMLDRLLDARANGMRQVMIFSFFRQTLAYLQERLSESFTVRVMNGKTPMSERQSIMEDFRAGRFEVLLLSQVGAEGLDFEFCNVMVNYDLPWNPMQVEQRIGRLDRFGQTSEKIFIFNMHVEGTIESDIIERLYHRIGVFERSIGELEPILRDDFAMMQKTILDPRLSESQREAELRRVQVALAERAEHIRALDESRGVLSTVDQLEIDGMTDSGPTDGRFIGPTEVQRLLQRLLARTGAKLSRPDRNGIFRLIGTVQLASLVTQSRARHSRSMMTKQHLARLLRDGEAVRVTFDNEVASKHDLELVSGRHLLVSVALEVLGADDLVLRRFGIVKVPGVSTGRRFAVKLDLATTTGLRPQRELWATAVDLDTGSQDESLGGQLLEAVARGTLLDGSGEVDPRLTRVLPRLEDLAFSRQVETERVRRADNEALVDARIESQRKSIELKLRRADETLREVTAANRDASIRRLHEGRIRNLSHDLEMLAPALADKRSLHVSLQPTDHRPLVDLDLVLCVAPVGDDHPPVRVDVHRWRTMSQRHPDPVARLSLDVQGDDLAGRGDDPEPAVPRIGHGPERRSPLVVHHAPLLGLPSLVER